MNKFDLEEDFFKQKDFDNSRRSEWLDRIKIGYNISFPEKEDRSGWREEDPKEEELRYGKFEEIMPNLNLPEIKATALEGISFKFYNGEDEKDALINEYKKIFNLSEKEIENIILSKITQEKKILNINIKEDDKIRNKYKFIDNFLNSEEAKKLAKKEIVNDLISNTDRNISNYSEILKYFSIPENDFNQGEIKEKQTTKALISLSEALVDTNMNYGDSLAYEIEQESKVLSKEDWQNFFNKNKDYQKLINSLASVLDRGWVLDEKIELFNKIGVPVELFKKAGIMVIKDKIVKNSYTKPEEIEQFSQKLGLSGEEVKEGLTFGILNMIGRGSNNEYDIERIKETFKLDTVADSPEIQKDLKKIFLEQLERTDKNNVEIISKTFNIKWKTEENPARREALKKVLTDQYSLLRLGSVDQIKNFVDSYLPDKHKVFFLADPEIKKTAEKVLLGLPFSGRDMYRDQSFVEDFISYFNVSKENIINILKDRIASGEFIYDMDTINNFTRLFPEIDLDKENEICLEKDGTNIVENAFENSNWDELRKIQKSNNEKAKLQIQNVLKIQEENLKNETKSTEIRSFAVKSLANLSQGIEFIENNYFKELVEVYSATNSENLAELFIRKTDSFKVLDEKTRFNAFNILIKNDKSLLPLLQSDLSMLLTETQLSEAMNKTVYYTMIIGGLSKASQNNIATPDFIFNGLYNRLINEKNKDISGQAVDGFSGSIKDFIKNEVKDNRLLEKKEILREIAIDPNSITKVKRVIEQVSSSLLLNNWNYLYGKLKDLPSDEFEKCKILTQKIEPILDSRFLKNIPFSKLFEQILSYTQEEQNSFFEMLNMQNKKNLTEFNDKNWPEGIITYVNDTEDVDWLAKNENRKVNISELFSNTGKYKDVALEGMQKEWKTFLEGENKDFLPPNLFFISKMIDDAGGAGNLKHVEALGNLLFQIDRTLKNPKTVENTKEEIKNLFLAQEKRFEKEKISQDERSEFYNLSKDILEAAPSLYSAFSSIFEQMSPKDMKIFIKDVFPFYQAQLVIIQNMDKNDNVKYDPRMLVEVRQSLKDLLEKIKQNPENESAIFNEEKSRLLDIVKNGFKDRFGLIKIPEEFTKEDLRSVQNNVRYMGNIAGRNMEKESILAYYLGLELNKKWSSFRQGETIVPEEYISGKQLNTIKPILEERLKNYEKIAEILGINQEKIAKFQEILQEDVISNMTGNVQTIDVKLGNIKRNIDELIDLDIYNNKHDKDIISFLTKNIGDKKNKLIGSVLAKIYKESSGNKVEMNQEEKELQTEMTKIFNVSSWDINQVKKIQEEMQPFSLITNMVGKMKEEKVEQNIDELQKRLVPSEKIIQIFNRLGENFKQESGAVALFKDVAYLESLIIKDDEKLTPEEKLEVKLYLDSIKDKMKELENTLDKIKEYFNKIKKSSHLENHDILKNRIADIEKIIYSQNNNEMIVSHMTKDLNLIIENMRQCLGCLRREANNDTNLAFGDYNKFFMFNQAEKEKGSVSDEIVFFVPIQKPDSSKEMSFVLDNVYGSKSSDILISNILSVFKKYKTIKKEIPEANISISVSNAAMSSVGLSSESLQRRLLKLLEGVRSVEQFENLIAEIPKSVLSDNYVEFADGGARQTGERQFSGLVLR